jgi:uncharacterized membrane protein HdeD (DUF308 family)
LTPNRFVAQSVCVPDVTRAVEEIAEIHAHLAAREVYRGWRAIPVAVSGLVGLAAAAALTARQSVTDPAEFVRTWLAVGIVALVAGCAEIVWRYASRASPLERRRTRVVMRQFLPGLVAGVVLSLALVRLSPAGVAAVPGLWAICFAIAIFAARPCLPPASAWAASYYAVAGVILLTLAPTGVPAPWTVGATFGIGQGLAALLIHVTLERPSGRAHEDVDVDGR